MLGRVLLGRRQQLSRNVGLQIEGSSRHDSVPRVGLFLGLVSCIIVLGELGKRHSSLGCTCPSAAGALETAWSRAVSNIDIIILIDLDSLDRLLLSM